METIAMDFIHAKHFDEENCSGQLYTKYKLSKQNFSSQRTYATLEEKYETIRKMVYYKMPIQRKKKPGRNCEWIKSLSELEKSIIHHPKTMICNVPWHEYIASLPQDVSTERTMDMPSNAESQATDVAMIEDESTKETSFHDAVMEEKNVGLSTNCRQELESDVASSKCSTINRSLTSIPPSESSNQKIVDNVEVGKEAKKVISVAHVTEKDDILKQIEKVKTHVDNYRRKDVATYSMQASTKEEKTRNKKFSSMLLSKTTGKISKNQPTFKNPSPTKIKTEKLSGSSQKKNGVKRTQ